MRPYVTASSTLTARLRWKKQFRATGAAGACRGRRDRWGRQPRHSIGGQQKMGCCRRAAATPLPQVNPVKPPKTQSCQWEPRNLSSPDRAARAAQLPACCCVDPLLLATKHGGSNLLAPAAAGSLRTRRRRPLATLAPPDAPACRRRSVPFPEAACAASAAAEAACLTEAGGLRGLRAGWRPWPNQCGRWGPSSRCS
jgi:hypothetical protein